VRWTGAGFIGTLAGAALLPFIPEAPGPQGVVLAAAVLAAVFVSGVAERELGTHDDPRICVDETVGYWAAVALLPRTWPVLAAGFVVFRVLDAVKLPPYRWLDRLPGGWGVVLDDVGAGVATNLILRGLLALWPRLAS